jgi:hypothetical protein
VQITRNKDLKCSLWLNRLKHSPKFRCPSIVQVSDSWPIRTDKWLLGTNFSKLIKKFSSFYIPKTYVTFFRISSDVSLYWAILIQTTSSDSIPLTLVSKNKCVTIRQPKIISPKLILTSVTLFQNLFKNILPSCVPRVQISHLNGLIIQIIISEVYKLWRFSLCNFLVIMVMISW